MAGTEIAKAYVTLVPSMQGAQGQITKAILPEASKAGSLGGAAIGKNLGGSMLAAAKKFAAPLAGLFAAVAIKKFATASVNEFKDLTLATIQLKRVTGDTAEQASSMRGAFQLAGADTSKLNTAFTIFAKKASAAAGSTDKLAGLQKTLGVNLTKANGAAVPASDAIAAMTKKIEGARGDTSKLAEIQGSLGQKILDNKGKLVDHTKLLEATSKAYNKLTTTSSQAAVFNKLLGNSWKNADGSVKPFAKLLPTLADKFAAMPDGVNKTALATQLFGRQGASLLPALNKGSKGIDELQKKAKDLGIVIGEDGIDKFSKYKETVREHEAAVQGLKVTLGGVLLPMLTKVEGFISKTLGPALEHMVKWLKDSPAVKKFSDAFARLGDKAAKFGSGAMGKVLDFFKDLGKNVGPLIPSVLDIIKAFNPLGGILKDLLPTIAGIASQFSGSLTKAVVTLAPILTTVGGILANIVAKALEILLPKLAALGDWLSKHTGLIAAAALAWAGWKVGTLIVSMAKATAAIAKNTAAWVLNRAAALKDLATTALLKAMYGKDMVISMAKATGAWAKNTAAMLINKGTQLAMATAAKIAAAGQWILNAALSANPIGLVIAGITLLVAGLVWFFTKTKLGQKIVSAAWGGIKKAFSAVSDWWTKTLVPTAKRVFSTIGDAVSKVFHWVKDNWPLLLAILTGPIGLAVLAIAKNWDKIKSGLKSGWDWIGTHVFKPFGRGIDNIVTAFENAKKGVGKAFGGIKAAAAKPINFVLGTVYNDGIAKWWNKIAGAVGLDKLALPTATLIKYANGGVENHTAQIAKGGSMRLWAEPETGGEAYIPLASSKRSRSSAILGEVARRFGYGLTPYKDGGIVGWGKSAWNSAKSAVAGVVEKGVKIAGVAKDFITDPVGTVTKGLGSLVDKLLPKVGGGDLGKMVSVLPKKLVGGIADTVKSHFGSGGVSGDRSTGGRLDLPAGSGLGYKKMEAIAQSLMPGVRVTSDIRPGSVSVTGYPSLHAAGRAVDFGAGNGYSLPQIWDTFNKAYGTRSYQLLYSGEGANQIWWNHKRAMPPASIVAQHWNHVHWAMKNGGVLDGAGRSAASVVPTLYDKGGALPKGTSVVRNKTNKPEAVFTQSQLKALLAAVAKAASTTSRDNLAKSLSGATGQVSTLTDAAIKKESDRIIAARRKQNDRIKNANKAALKDRDKALAAAEKISDSKKRAAAKKAANAAYKKAKRDTLPAISRADADKQAKKNLANVIAAQKKAAGILNAQNKTTGIWKGLSATAGTNKLLNGLTSAGNFAKSASKAVKGVTLADIAKARENIASRLSAANDKLKAIQDNWTSLSSGVASQISGELDLTQGIGQATEDQIVQVTRTNSRGETWNEDKLVKGQKAKTTFASVAGTVKSLAAKAKTFAQKLQALVKKGIPPGLVQEVAGLGTDQGIQVANALLSGSSAQVKDLSKDYASLTSWSDKAGASVADQMYGVAIQAQQGLIDGLNKDDDKLEKAATKLSNRVVAAAKKALGIKSPSRVFRDQVGLNITKGVGVGLDRGQGQLNKRLSTLVDPGRVNTNLDDISGNPASAGVQVNNHINADGFVAERYAREIAEATERKTRDAYAVAGIGRISAGV